jgi:hypothetical protein
MESVIQSIADKLQEAAIKGFFFFFSKLLFFFNSIFFHSGGSQTTLRRVEFIETCNKILIFDDVSSKQLSLLFSLFDPMKRFYSVEQKFFLKHILYNYQHRNSMRYVEFIACLKVLDNPEDSPYDKLKMVIT